MLKHCRNGNGIVCEWAYSAESDAEDVADDPDDVKEWIDGFDEIEFPDVSDVNDAGRVPISDFLLKSTNPHTITYEIVKITFTSDGPYATGQTYRIQRISS